MEKISERIKQALQMFGISQAELCKRTGIPKASISQYISGYVKPKDDRLYLIAKALGVNESWLLGYDVPMDAGFEKRIKAYAEKLANVEHVTDDEVDNLTVRAFRMAQKFDKADDKMKDMIEKALSVPSDYDVTIVEDNGNEIVFTISMGE